jgi:pimeloyl-ACP methyl ester carboxylesterase
MSEVFFREAGSGPGVVCLHANASTSGQWRGLMERLAEPRDPLAPTWRVLAPDLYDSGKGLRWPSDSVIRLRDEVAMLAPVLARAGSPFSLVGHSYGGAVALMAALENPGSVKALALYEPTLFALIEAEGFTSNDADGIRGAVAGAVQALEAGDEQLAAERFIDYWMGAGAWAKTPEERKPAIASSVLNIRRWAYALMREPTPLAAFRALDMPVLYMLGKRSTAAAHGVAKRLIPVLPRVEVVEFDNLGHMGPVTHPQPVNDTIARFLESIG